MTHSKKQKDQGPKYQEMLGEVENIIQQMSHSDLDLDTLVDKIERGYVLLTSMRKRLDETQLKIEKLRASYEEIGEPSPETEDA